MSERFETVVHAKCILAGEHAVLRNCTLLAKSIKSCFLELKYVDNNQPLKIILNHSLMLSTEKLNHTFTKLLSRAIHTANQNSAKLKGQFIITSNIPLSAGLGFSAAICVALTEWVIFKGWISEDTKFEFAKSLENMFHGESSGADIAACLSDDIIIFKRPQSITVLHPKWIPKLYIKNSDIKSVTLDAINMVTRLQAQQPELASLLDQKMNQAVITALTALQDPSSQALFLLKQAFDLAQECFVEWGLIPPKIAEEIAILQSRGAIAVKPTGAGNGGSILSLWREEPDDELRKELMPVF